MILKTQRVNKGEILKRDYNKASLLAKNKNKKKKKKKKKKRCLHMEKSHSEIKPVQERN
ncbi:hypothetical protein ASPZODRAFT_1187816 [Penicilliopsis zonata CBS 506.65]|uniref:Uncharacterized protein n=1 Tax=Penicilliopsis zonata CBS 506.65 TaxID=1073090 RepID=A0A1L9S7W8_9EURO|nr:hypothetical protein ASPZODRAFT_1187816 [Penicilliopsis zonata CBS 506.65]OJJ43266.1 hypothetical protein ASPZODRAFT_1187816 [Penicilliopsis zonata CBS 506.65]